jgi:hypothetical protein
MEMNTGFIKRYIDTDMAFTIQAHEMLHAEQRRDKMTRFEVGDKVKVVEKTSDHYGQVGTISMEATYYDWWVDFDDDEDDAFYERYLELVEEEEEMTKETKPKYFRGQPLITKDGDEVTFLYDDGDNFWPVRVLNENKDDTDYLNYSQLEPSNKFTFAQVVQGLLEGYFEDGTEFKVLGMSVFADKAVLHGFGLKKEKNGDYVEMEIGANLINATWELVVPEEPIKELTLDELEELLGYKVKIKNND